MTPTRGRAWDPAGPSADADSSAENEALPRLPPPTPTRPTWRERAVQLTETARVALTIGGIYLAALVIGRPMAALAQRRIAKGKTIWLDERRPAPDHAPEDAPPVCFEPRQTRPRKSKVMKLAAYPEPRYPFAYREPPVSGNVTNGLGERQPRQPRRVFHTYDERVPLSRLQLWFQLRNSLAQLRGFLRHAWQSRHKTGPVSAKRWPVTDEADAARRVKGEAKALGASTVGITRLEVSDIFAGRHPGELKTAISIAAPMRRDDMLYTPSIRSGVAIMDGYTEVARIATALAEHIRALGWKAKASTDMEAADFLHVPVAVRAGLGELGKHGSLITLEHGSNVRLSTVLTDMPLTLDSPRDLGIEDFCLNCQVCQTNCPPGAIAPAQQLVRGVERWYVNFDRCIPYFVENQGCGICIEVCPWSIEGRGPLISAKSLARRANAS